MYPTRLHTLHIVHPMYPYTPCTLCTLHPQFTPLHPSYTHIPMYPTPRAPHAPRTPCTPCTPIHPLYPTHILTHPTHPAHPYALYTPRTLHTHTPCTPHAPYTSYTPYALLLEHLPQESKQPNLLQGPPEATPQGGLPDHLVWKCPTQGSSLPTRPQSIYFFPTWVTVCFLHSLSALGEGLAFLCILSVRTVPGTWLGFGSVWRG